MLIVNVQHREDVFGQRKRFCWKAFQKAKLKKTLAELDSDLTNDTEHIC